MATDKNITMKQFNGTDYDTLYPKTKAEQVEGVYTQQQTLADSTKTLYNLGSDAVPDDILKVLSGSMMHKDIFIASPNGVVNAVAYGDGKFVATSQDSGAAAYSNDGIVWSVSTLPVTQFWECVAYGNGKFVTMGSSSSTAAYSTDGINWTATTMPYSSGWSCLTYGDGKFVALVRGSTNAAYSTDGINWTAMTMPSSAYWDSVAYGDGKFVAIASNTETAAYSTDGINWTTTTLPSSVNWSSIAYGDGKFVAVAKSSNKSAYSTDGINWTATTMPYSSGWSCIAYGGGKFVALADGDYDNAAYSTDGISWSGAYAPYGLWKTVVYGGDKFIAGASGMYLHIMCSLDGVTWTGSATIFESVKVATGYYIGTGRSGEVNHNTLIFDFVPQVVFITDVNYGYYHAPGWQRGASSGVCVMDPTPTIKLANLSWSGNSVSWYGDNANAQLNHSGYPYVYTAIG